MLLISDLHLQTERPDITRTLVDFLRGRATETEQLFILGDLFEVWIGDDDSNPLADLVAQELNALSNKGVEIFLMHGNRDFLLGKEFAARCGASLINEPFLYEIDGQKFAFMHGDILCSRDVEYMKFRTMVRNDLWQREFLAKTLAERQAFAQQARQQSQQNTSNKAAQIMDVSAEEVVRIIKELHLTTLIHGHTHRPAVHTVSLEASNEAVDGENPPSRSATRVVLGDWDKQGWLVEVTGTAASLEKFPLLI